MVLVKMERMQDELEHLRAKKERWAPEVMRRLDELEANANDEQQSTRDRKQACDANAFEGRAGRVMDACCQRGAVRPSKHLPVAWMR